MDKLIAMTGQSELPFDVWIDDEDRVRRVETEMTMGQSGMELKAHVTIEYVRFGVPVEIDVPDDGDVVDATDLALQQMDQTSP